MSDTVAFPLPAGVSPDGVTLAREIKAATGIDISEAYSFLPPASIEVAEAVVGTQAAQVQAVVDAHKGTPLAEIKAQALRKIDVEAEECRLRYVTPGEVQQAVYRLKDEEVKRYRNDPAPDPLNYPVLSAEVGISAGTLADMVTLVEQTKANWVAIAAETEKLRKKAKKDIQAATTAADVELAATVAWPKPA